MILLKVMIYMILCCVVYFDWVPGQGKNIKYSVNILKRKWRNYNEKMVQV